MTYDSACFSTSRFASDLSIMFVLMVEVWCEESKRRAGGLEVFIGRELLQPWKPKRF